MSPAVIHSSQRGASLLALTAVLCLCGMILVAWGESKLERQNLHQQIELSTLQELKQIRLSLFAHANLKGLNSLTHPGNMPCPSATPNGTTPATCLNAWLGYLPIESRSAVNHLRLAIHAKPNAKSVSQDKFWRYAVSPQVIQPNELGWSQWVDWTQASLTVLHDGEITSDVAVAVAENLEFLDTYKVQTHGSYLLLRTSDLQRAVSNAQTASILNTFNTWKSQNPQMFQHENLMWDEQTQTAQPKWPDCKCSCTRSRCTCACEDDSWWTSTAACLTESETCQATSKWNTAVLAKGKPLSYVCNAKKGSTCIFKGNSRLLSAWPVSTTLPVAAKGKSCEQFEFGFCPLSSSSTSCTCDFNWPSNSKAYLPRINIQVNSGTGHSSISNPEAL